MGVNDKILELVKQKGPVLPVQVSKEINDNILMTSARLSELLTNKQIKISNVKVGGSPLYYVLGQETRLQDFSDNLANKEKEAYNLLQQNKVLMDKAQEPAIRVALREIKDFSIPLQVKFQGQTEIFWKWYLIDNNEAQPVIKEILSRKEQPKEEVKTQTKILNTVKQPITPQREINEEQQQIKQETVDKEKPEPARDKQLLTQKQDNEPKPELKLKPKPKADKTLFLKQTNNFFGKNNITVLETEEVRKNVEIDYVIELQTTIGSVRYFCKSKNKKKINDSDLGSALMQAQSKNLPLLFLTKGKISKKAEEKLKTDFKNIVYREI